MVERYFVKGFFFRAIGGENIPDGNEQHSSSRLWTRSQLIPNVI
jgi:hypothetical protein